MYEIFNATGLNKKQIMRPVVVEGRELICGASMVVDKINRRTRMLIDKGILLQRKEGSSISWRSLMSPEFPSRDVTIPEDKRRVKQVKGPISPVLDNAEMDTVDLASLVSDDSEGPSLSDIDGLDDDYINELEDAGIDSVELLSMVKRKKGAQISDILDVEITVVRRWVKQAQSLLGASK